MSRPNAVAAALWCGIASLGAAAAQWEYEGKVAEGNQIDAVTGHPVDIDLQYSDPDGPGPYAFDVGSPSHGVLSGTAPSLTCSPGSGFAGSDAFTWSVSDGKDSSATATVTVEVYADTDGDELPDWWEDLYELDPNSSDSDGDGIPDGAEDEDGTTNLQEYDAGTNPLVNESASDGDSGVSCCSGVGEGRIGLVALCALAIAAFARGVSVRRSAPVLRG